MSCDPEMNLSSSVRNNNLKRKNLVVLLKDYVLCLQEVEQNVVEKDIMLYGLFTSFRELQEIFRCFSMFAKTPE